MLKHNITYNVTSDWQKLWKSKVVLITGRLGDSTPDSQCTHFHISATTWPREFLLRHPTTPEEYQEQSSWPAGDALGCCCCCFIHLPWPQDWQTSHWHLPKTAVPQLDELLPSEEMLPKPAVIPLTLPYLKATSPCLDEGEGFCVHVLNFRLQATTFSITYSCHNPQGGCYGEPTPKNPSLIKAAIVRPSIHIGI